MSVHSLWPQHLCQLWLQLGSMCGSGLSLGIGRPSFFTPSGPEAGGEGFLNGLYTSFLNPTPTSVGGPFTAPLW